MGQERDFVLRVDGQQRFVYTRRENVLNTEVEAYGYVDSRRRATVFRGAPEDDVALIERISLQLGRWKRDLVVDDRERLDATHHVSQIFLIRVAQSVRHPAWRAGAWIRAPRGNFEICQMRDAQIYTNRRTVEGAVAHNTRNYHVKFEIIQFDEAPRKEANGQADETGAGDLGACTEEPRRDPGAEVP